MNFKKIIAAVAASALMLSTMAFSASAADPLTYKMQVVNINGVAVTQDVTIEGNGTYSVEFTDLVDAPFQQFNTSAPTGDEVVPAAYANASITLDSVTINGDIDWPVAPDGANTFALVSQYAGAGDPVVNYNFFNIWYKEGNMVDDTNMEPNSGGNGYNFKDADGANITITSLAATFTISGVDGEGATTAPATGNVSVYVLGSIMALAAVAVVASRKRK
ncbi:MAG: hypothetical protein LBL80_03190 [Ruminococcus sp.]|jgi:hypothetical protein|nr:hypothetical protein [Ruminococcus sp.]